MGFVLKMLLGFCVFLLAWVLLALILTAQLTYGGMPWTLSLAASIEQMIPWFLTSPLVIYFCYRFPILYDRWLLHSVLHVLLAFLILLMVSYIREYMFDLWAVEVDNGPGSVAQGAAEISMPTDEIVDLEQQGGLFGLVQRISESALLGVPLYLIIVFIFSVGRHRSEIGLRDQRALKLETQLTQTQLDLLRLQLQPHFLFNTLNSISSLIHSDPDKADGMVIQLSGLLRRTLDQRKATFVSLDEEIDTVKTYLKIQSMRFCGRMLTRISIDDDTVKLLVPPMILLPLVENAVRYGVEKSSEPTTISITSSTSEGQLILKVSDDGPGIKSSNESGTGVGLANTQSRLETLYPSDDCGVTLKEENDSVTAIVEFPIQQQEI